MSPVQMTILWAGLLLLFVIIEAITVQLVSIWFALGALGGVISAACKADFSVQIAVFLVLSIIALILTRPLVKKFFTSKLQSTNADRVIGKQAVVTEEINNIMANGSVKVLGNVWTARSADESIIPKDTIVIVEKIDGVKLIVKNL